MTDKPTQKLRQSTRTSFPKSAHFVTKFDTSTATTPMVLAISMGNLSSSSTLSFSKPTTSFHEAVKQEDDKKFVREQAFREQRKLVKDRPPSSSSGKQQRRGLHQDILRIRVVDSAGDSKPFVICRHSVPAGSTETSSWHKRSDLPFRNVVLRKM